MSAEAHRPPWSPAQRAEAVRLAKEGLDASAIAARMGKSAHGVKVALAFARAAAPDARRKRRRCLGPDCGAEFLSEHAGHRLCDNCRGRVAREADTYSLGSL